jgi:hypothetical protein
VETAIDYIKWYQHNHTAIFGKPTNRRESSRDDDYDVDLTTQVVTKAETKKDRHASKMVFVLLVSSNSDRIDCYCATIGGCPSIG